MQPNRRTSRAERSAARHADARRRSWEAMRGLYQPIDAFGVYEHDRTGAPGPGPEIEPGPSSRLQALMSPLVGAAGVVLAVTGGSPAVTGHWNPLWLLLGLLVAGSGAWSSLRSFEDGHRRRVASSGAVAALVVASLVVGIGNQVVVDGRARLSGGETAAGARRIQEAVSALATLRSNQQLLGLSAEQAAALEGSYQEAVDVDLGLAQEWNPATAGVLPGDGLGAVYETINRIAVWQADALAGFAMNIAQPVADVAAEVERLRVAVETQLAPGGVLEMAIDDAWRRSTGSTGSLFGLPPGTVVGDPTTSTSVVLPPVPSGEPAP